MFSYFFPSSYEASVYSIPFGKLKERNIEVLLFDMDNTLKPRYVADPDEKLVKFISRLKSMGFKICVISNGNSKRVETFARQIQVDYVAMAAKPMLFGVNKALKKLKARPQNTAIIGDQIFTDIFVGKRRQMTTILVKPISEKDDAIVKSKRGVEKLVLNEYKKQGHDTH